MKKERGTVACHCQSLSHRGVDSHLVQRAFIYREKTRTEKQCEGGQGQTDRRLESKTHGRNEKIYIYTTSNKKIYRNTASKLFTKRRSIQFNVTFLTLFSKYPVLFFLLD